MYNDSMNKKIAINGFGRIGRLFFKQALRESSLDIVAVNDLGDAENLAYLLQYDSVYGRFDGAVEVKEKNGETTFVVNGKEIRLLRERDPANLPWGDMEIDVVVEATGAFNSFEKSQAHVQAGAKRVVITAPAKDGDGELGHTILGGINEELLSKAPISSNGSCTTNAASPVIQALLESVGIEKAALSTIHGYTASQSLVDGPSGKDFRKGRAAAQNIVPSTTGAAIAVSRAIPDLEDKFDGIAMRVPVVSGSAADITLLASRKTSPEEVNEILRTASRDARWEHLLAVTEDPVVSSDIVGQPYGAIVDLSFTRVVDGDLVKVLSWYDNEAGYVATLVRHVAASAQHCS